MLQQINSAEYNEKIEQLVRERVAEELKRTRDQQEQVNKSTYGELAKKNIENDHNSVAMKEDIETMIQKLQRYSQCFCYMETTGFFNQMKVDLLPQRFLLLFPKVKKH